MYKEFVETWMHNLPNWDGDLLDLTDEAKDEAVFIWLLNHESWYPDIYPASFSPTISRIATQMLFGEVRANNAMMVELFMSRAQDAPDDYGDDECWWSEALNDIDASDPDFANTCRENIYLYLEDRLREAVQDDYGAFCDDY